MAAEVKAVGRQGLWVCGVVVESHQEPMNWTDKVSGRPMTGIATRGTLIVTPPDGRPEAVHVSLARDGKLGTVQAGQTVTWEVVEAARNRGVQSVTVRNME